MVRNYKPKTDRGKADGGMMKRAVEEVENGCSVRQFVQDLHTGRITLSRYVKKYQAGQAPSNYEFIPCFSHRQVGT